MRIRLEKPKGQQVHPTARTPPPVPRMFGLCIFLYNELYSLYMSITHRAHMISCLFPQHPISLSEPHFIVVPGINRHQHLQRRYNYQVRWKKSTWGQKLCLLLHLKMYPHPLKKPSCRYTRTGFDLTLRLHIECILMLKMMMMIIMSFVLPCQEHTSQYQNKCTQHISSSQNGRHRRDIVNRRTYSGDIYIYI